MFRPSLAMARRFAADAEVAARIGRGVDLRYLRDSFRIASKDKIAACRS
jgi:hypothetical protein